MERDEEAYWDLKGGARRERPRAFDHRRLQVPSPFLWADLCLLLSVKEHGL